MFHNFKVRLRVFSPVTCHLSPITAFFSALIFLLSPLAANAGLIRDAEIEHTLRAYTAPIFAAADIPAEDVRIFIVSDPAINAYVAGGLNIFINTGLIRQATKPGMLIGVLAHETGHISGAHLSQYQAKSTRAMVGGILGALVGAAAIAGGAKQAGVGVILGSQSMAQRSLFTDIRLNEQSADHAALSFLDASDISATGMLDMFEVLHRQEIGAAPRDQFMSDHPLSTDRMATMRNHIAQSSIPADQVPDGFSEMHARMVAKLVAFTEDYATTINLYPASDQSIAGRYAHAIADFKRSKLPEALAGINSLITQHPKDAFFYDTKAQILFENGKLSDAAAAYAHASTLMPNSALILTDYAKTLIALDKPAELPRAIALLERSKEIDDSYTNTWRQLALAYGKQGRIGLSYEALAEEAALNGDYKTVLQHVARARSDPGSDASLKLLLDDLERDAKAQLDEKKKKDRLF